MIDELVLVGSHFLFLQQQQYIVLVTPSLWWHIWGAVLAVERGGRGGLLCANNKPSTPRYTPLGKPVHPTDRPTGTKKQLLILGGSFFSFFCLRFAPFEPQQSNRQNNNKKEPLFLYCSMPPLSYIITTLLSMYYSV